MDREFLLALLALLSTGPALLLSGWWPIAKRRPRENLTEQKAWKQMWIPLLPAALCVAALAGWALAEPDEAEPLPSGVVVIALSFAFLWARAGLRAIRSARPRQVEPPAAAVGLFWPRAVLSPALEAELDEAARAAARAHEAAHVRHLDPLRIWIAQLVSDLQWPWPQARARFHAWQEALELARDEEARRGGVAGEDLAAAIVAAARLERAAVAGAGRAVAGLAGRASILEARIARLLAPMPPAGRPDGRSTWSALVLALLLGAVAFGSRFGEMAVRRFLGLT